MVRVERFFLILNRGQFVYLTVVYSSSSHSLQAKLKPKNMKTSCVWLFTLPLGSAASHHVTCTGGLWIMSSALSHPTFHLHNEIYSYKYTRVASSGLEATATNYCKLFEAIVTIPWVRKKWDEIAVEKLGSPVNIHL